MNRNFTTSSVGAFHPAVFFTLVYIIALFLALFVCRTVYEALNPAGEGMGAVIEQANAEQANGATAYR